MLPANVNYLRPPQIHTSSQLTEVRSGTARNGQPPGLSGKPLKNNGNVALTLPEWLKKPLDNILNVGDDDVVGPQVVEPQLGDTKQPSSALSQQDAQRWVETLFATSGRMTLNTGVSELGERASPAVNQIGESRKQEIKEAFATIARTPDGKELLEYIFKDLNGGKARNFQLSVEITSETAIAEAETSGLIRYLNPATGSMELGSNPSARILLNPDVISKDCALMRSGTEFVQGANTTMVLYHELVHIAQAIAININGEPEVYNEYLENNATARSDVFATQLEALTGEQIGQRGNYFDQSVKTFCDGEIISPGTDNEGN
jgi:Effector protein